MFQFSVCTVVWKHFSFENKDPFFFNFLKRFCNLIFFNRRIIALQCCVGFCCTTMWISHCCCLVTKSHLTFWDPMDCSIPDFSVLHHLLEFTQTHVHWVNNAIQPSRSPSFPSLVFHKIWKIHQKKIFLKINLKGKSLLTLVSVTMPSIENTSF